MEAKPLIYQFNGVRIDLRSFQAFRDQTPLQMEPKAFEVLVFMIENRGRLIEKTEILDRVWADTAVTENAMTRVIAQLRRVLGDHAKEARYIETVPRRGYRFIATVNEINGVSSETSDGARTTLSNVIKTTLPDELAPVTMAPEGAGFRFVRRRTNLLAALFVTTLGAASAVGIWRARARHDGPVRPSSIRTVQITSSSGLDIFPSFSPDGTSIAFSSSRSGTFEIYVKQLGGGREVQVTSDGLENLAPAWSPDGRLIAYCSRKRGGICVVSSLGGAARQITDFGSYPAWSPDGSRIAFQSGPIRDLTANASAAGPPSTIWLVSATGGAPTQITLPGSTAGGHGAPSWSPDGKRIVFSSSDFSLSDIWSVRAEAGELQGIVVGRQHCYEPVYSADGRSIYYSTEGAGLFQQQVNTDTGAPVGGPVQIMDPGTTGIRNLAVSSNGKRILYSAISVQSNIWSIPVSARSGEPGGSPRGLTQNSNYRNTSPGFSPDGRKVAFDSWRRAASPEIWLMDPDGSNQVQITEDSTTHSLSGWYLDADHLAYSSVRNGRFGIDGLALSTGRETRLVEVSPNAGFYVRVSPDGRAIAYHSPGEGALNVWIQQIPGGQARQLTFDTQSMAFPCWSPDAKFLALEMTHGDDTNISVVPSAGGTPAQLTHDRGLSWAYSWSPDGDKIAFAGCRNGVWNVYWVARSTGEQKQVTDYSKVNSYVRYPSWSPLGNRIVYEYAETTGNIWMAEWR